MEKEKFIKLTAVLVLSAVLCSCDQASKVEENTYNTEDDSEMVSSSKTKNHFGSEKGVNYKDVKGLRQGFWRLPASDFPERVVLDSSLVLEEGNYNNDLKEGEWKCYNNNGELDSLVYYSRGKVDSVVVK